MASVSESITTIMSNVESGANELFAAVLSEINTIITGDYLLTGLGEPPDPSTPPPLTITEPTELYAMLNDALASLHEVGQGIPALEELIGTPTSEALDKYMEYALKYRGLLADRLAGLAPTDTYQVLFAALEELIGTPTSEALDKYMEYVLKYRGLLADRLTGLAPTDTYQVLFADRVRSEGLTVPTILSPLMQTPQAGQDGFTNYLNVRLAENADTAYYKAKFTEAVLQSSVDVALNELAIRAALEETTSLLEFCRSAIGGFNAIIRKTVVAPQDVIRIFDMLSSARSKVSVGIADNRAAYAGTQMEYINALIGYYDIYSDLERVRVRGDILEHTLDAEANNLIATQLAGAAAASAAVAAAGYAAVRVNFALSQKQFS